MVPTFTPASEFVPTSFDASNWDNLKPLYTALLERPLHCKKCIERLIIDRSELDSAANEAETSLYIDMTCHTDDKVISGAYLKFVSEVSPEIKKISFELDKRIVGHAAVGELDAARYGVLLRDMRGSIELFREANLPLEVESAKLEQQYQSLIGAMTVVFQGTEHTLPQMAKYQEVTDRAVREDAFRVVAERRLKDKDQIEDIFDKLIALRHTMATNAGFANFRDFAFKARRRFDYTVADCNSYAEGVEQSVVPAMRAINTQRLAALGYTSLRPWDMSVDVKGRAPLKPFTDGADLYERSLKLFRRMDESLGELFAAMRTGGCLDLDSRKGKGPGGYQATRDRQRMPFIFMNAAGVQRDVETMVHEAGHAFHALLARADNILAYRSGAPIEFCEVASMSMELTAGPFLDEFYTTEEAARAKRVHLEGIASILPWIATIDQFQHWIYTNVGHTRQQRSEQWCSLLAKYGASTDWSGLEEIRAFMWHRQPHLFTSPFYYIEYGIAQLGAIQLYGNYKRDAKKAIVDYKAALTLGGSQPLPKLFNAAGLQFDFSPARIKGTWAEVERELVALPV